MITYTIVGIGAPLNKQRLHKLPLQSVGRLLLWRIDVIRNTNIDSTVNAFEYDLVGGSFGLNGVNSFEV